MKRKRNFIVPRIGAIQFNKRQKFVVSVLILSLGLFFSEYLLGKSGIIFSVVLSCLTDILFFVSIRQDIEKDFALPILILPFFYTLSFGLFFFLFPARFVTRVMITIPYAVGLYSLFLSQNIFIVASIRTIALLSSARIVSLIIVLVSYFFLSSVVFSLHLPLWYTLLLFFIFSFFLIFQSIWTITLEKSLTAHLPWVLVLSLCIIELCSVLWFWPSTASIVSIFLTGFFYITVSISQAWFDKRLFKGVIWEYIWVAVIVVTMLLAFTSW